ncbi:phospholipase D-like domain-containing protein [Nonomuraea turkmeniaca]|uniref:phospholipase D-like domain-containing protein n=1 Tax=Nonomuraea turkmeniaca TaxID=103838 RepID=UPI001476D49C|nr:phosphatidylserine/phosphatidylglycerophosphate/cardiolipin synthase family protein [Nonomuraea turkmeniaca]
MCAALAAVLSVTVPAGTASAEDLDVVPLAAVPIDRSYVENYVEFDDGKHEKIAAHALRLINAAAGGDLTITLYYFDRPEIVDALSAAAKRGVNVRVVIDGWNIGRPTYKKLMEAATVPPVGQRVKVMTCGRPRVSFEGRMVASRGCIANREWSDENGEPDVSPSIMHNKFMTLSAVLSTEGTLNNVVYVSSANLDWYGGQDRPEHKAFENVVTLTSPDLYQFYANKYFDDLWFGPSTTGDNDYGSEPENNLKTVVNEVYTFPRETDPIADQIWEAHRACSTTAQDDIIRVANFRISRETISSTLASALQRGCTVQVVTGDQGDDASTPNTEEYYTALENIVSAGVDVKLCKNDRGFPQMHEKTVIINHSNAAGLYIGSQNLTDGGLRYGDENVLRVMKDSPLMAKFNQRFDFLHATCPSWKIPESGRAFEDVGQVLSDAG